ncbi:hypothetical protein [Gottfriedia luciferensis]|uniref:hypothetical protein n=1 Tax=Gottfriedia luciferensis TaxID=178774 RepID=UPI000B432429|nr:hypothetical protein [Gottfriedia luciferensis]
MLIVDFLQKTYLKKILYNLKTLIGVEGGINKKQEEQAGRERRGKQIEMNTERKLIKFSKVF